MATKKEVTEDYASQPKGETCSYEVLVDETAIEGKLYKAGDKVKLDKEQAALLQSRGVCLSEVTK